jgi:hypothetical protein
MEETKWMTDRQAILGMVSESPGRNVGEPTGGLDKNESEAGPLLGAKAACAARSDRRHVYSGGW